MPIIKKPVQLEWTIHARAKMNHYRLSPSRVRHVLHSPKRTEEGIAPETVAMMQPVSTKKKDGKEVWSQEIWVMVQDNPKRRLVVSAWRYPGMTLPRSSAALAALRREYGDFVKATKKTKES